MASKKDKKDKQKETPKQDKKDEKSLKEQNEIAKQKDSTTGTTSKERITEIMDKIEITSCDTIVTPPSSYDGSGGSGNASCGNGWNVNAACADATEPDGYAYSAASYTKPRSKICSKHCYSCGWGLCTPSVAGHITAGGIQWHGRCGYGWEMKDFLPNFGFNSLNFPISELNTYPKMKAWTSKYVLKGDVCVMTHGTHAWARNKSGAGHAAMWNGKNWSSDFIQCNALVYSGYDSVGYTGVQIFRFKECTANNDAGGEGGSASKLTPPTGGGGKELSLTLKRLCMTDKWTYGKLYINGVYYCDAIECGKNGSSNPQNNPNKTAAISPTTYPIKMGKSDGFTEHALHPEKYTWSPEFGDFLKKDLLLNGVVYMPRVGGSGISDVSHKDKHSGILIHGGRGSSNSLGCIVLGRALTKEYVLKYKNSNELLFAPKGSTKAENSKIYSKDWSIYLGFYQKLIDVAGARNKEVKVATLTIKHEFWS